MTRQLSRRGSMAIVRVVPQCPQCTAHLAAPDDLAVNPTAEYEAECSCGWKGYCLFYVVQKNPILAVLGL